MPSDAVSLRLLNDKLSNLPTAVSTASSRVIIPFSSGHGTTMLPMLDTTTGRLTKTGVIAFGVCSPGGTFTVTDGINFSIPFGIDLYQYFFSFPFDAKLVAVSATFNNWGAISFSKITTHMSPYVAIATTANDGTYNFSIRENSRVYPNPGYDNKDGVTYKTSTVLSALRDDLDENIAGGALTAIVGGILGLGTTYENLGGTEWIYMHGSLVFELGTGRANA